MDDVSFGRSENTLMALLSEGKNNNEIAEDLQLARVTIEKRLTKIYRKIGVKNRVQAVLYWNKRRRNDDAVDGE